MQVASKFRGQNFSYPHIRRIGKSAWVFRPKVRITRDLPGPARVDPGKRRRESGWSLFQEQAAPNATV